MTNFMLLVPILFPIAAGAAIGVLRIGERKLRCILYESVAVLNAVFTWALILFGARGRFSLLQLSESFSLELHLDSFGCFFAGMTSILWVIATVYAFGYMQHEERENVFLAFYTMTLGVTQGICFSANLLTIFVFYEMLTLVTLPLVIHKFNSESMVAGRRYAVYSLGGSSLAFIGTVVLSVKYGSSIFMPNGFVDGGREMLWVCFVTIIGFGVKACIFPMHGWLVSASAAPTPVTALLHAVAVVKAGVFAIVRTVYYVCGTDYLGGTWVQQVLLALAIITLLYGAAMALKERHFKRRLAYSTISNLSYILFGVFLMSEAGLAAGLSHMLFHAVIKICGFFCVGAFMVQTGKEYIYELDGVGRRMPVTFGCFAAASLSLVGIPPFCGFLSKWRLCSAGVASGELLGYIGTAALMLAAFLCAVYMFSVVIRAFFPKEGRDHFIKSRVSEAPKAMLVPIVALAGINLILGLFGGGICEIVDAVASAAF